MPARTNLPVPEAVSGLQINFCKNPECPNFGVEPFTAGQKHYRYLKRDPKQHSLQCKSCNRITIVKSNQSVVDECDRFRYHFPEDPELCCQNSACSNHLMDVNNHPEKYNHFGSTAAGQPRYRCKQCSKTFSRKKKGRKHRRPELNERIYLALVNKIPINRICEIENVQPKTVYDKLQFLYERCQQFSAEKEAKLKNKGDYPFFLATDTRNYHLNWQRSSQRKNVCLQTVTTTDISSSYVLGCHSNIDPGQDLKKIERELQESGAIESASAFRPHAHFLLSNDYGHSGKTPDELRHLDLLDDVEQKYLEMTSRKDFGVAEVLNRYTSPPAEGVQVRFDYTLYGHFAWLKQTLPVNNGIIFYLAYDSGLREACLSLFSREIIDNTANAFYVRTEQSLSIAAKRQRIREANDILRKYQKKYPHLDAKSIELALIRDRMSTMPAIGHWGDRWLIHPHPHMGEPGKAVSHTTNTGKGDPEVFAEYYRRASLYPSRHFYERLQNRISVVPDQNETGPSGQWNLYGAYKPSVVIKLIEIFRTYNNFVLTDKFGQTPAQRLGLSSEVLTIKDIIT